MTGDGKAGERVSEPKPRKWFGDLHDYATGRFIRPATAEEQAESREAAKWDGGSGVIVKWWGAQPRSCYVDD